MGRSLGGLVKVAGLVALVVLWVPVLALVPAMVVDRGEDGAVRFSAFPAALVVLDPLVWRCVRNSVAVASAVTVGSLVVGTGLGTLLGRRRFWGRWLLGGLALVPLAVGPIWMTPGVVAWIGGESGWGWLAARSFLGQPGDDWARWLGLVWVGVAGGTPLAILATRAALTRVDPAWADAARVVVGSRRQVWLDVTWPTLRPELARIGGAIFTWNLIEPSGPILLGLRRTLVVELADAALRFDEPNRAATLAAVAVGVAVVARGLLDRWGGAAFAPLRGVGDITPIPRAGARLGGFAVACLLLWLGFALGPVVTCARQLGVAALGDHQPDLATLRSLAEGWTTPEARAWGFNSIATASLAVGLDLVVLIFLATGARGTGRRLAAVPPLALATGALAVPWLLATWADATGWPALAASLGAIRAELSPGRSPGFLLVAVLACTRLPGLVGAAGPARPQAGPGPLDAALLAGATGRPARRLARDRSSGIGVRFLIWAWTWAATDLASAWLLTALDERRTLAPAALDLIEVGTGAFDPRLLGLFAAMTGLRLVGLACLARGRRADRGDGRISGA